jgi:hypothetical protein
MLSLRVYLLSIYTWYAALSYAKITRVLTVNLYMIMQNYRMLSLRVYLLSIYTWYAELSYAKFTCVLTVNLYMIMQNYRMLSLQSWGAQALLSDSVASKLSVKECLGLTLARNISDFP